MKNLLWISTLFLLLASCSTVKQNGYYQTKKYRTGIVKKSKNGAKSERNAHLLTVMDVVRSGVVQHPLEPFVPELEELQEDCIELNSKASVPRAVAIPTIQNLRNNYKASNSIRNHQPSTLGVLENLLQQSPIISSIDTVSRQRPINQQPVHWAAIVGFVSSLLFFLAPLIFGLCTVGFSVYALYEIAQEPDWYRGRNLAIAALAILALQLILVLALVFVFLVVFATL